MTDNRFARQLDELDADERRLVIPAMAAAKTTFAGFEERPESAYHEAPEMSPEDTWARIAEELARVSALATLEGHRDRPLEVGDVALIHRGIFEPVFGEQTLGVRSGRRKEEVTFPIVVGSMERPEVRVARGTGGKKIERKLRKALECFDQEVATLAARSPQDKPRLDEAALTAVKLYVKVISVHPFFDGNGRTAWAVFGYALQRCGLVEIAIPPSDTTRWALGRALRDDGGQSYDPLTNLVVQAIRKSGPGNKTRSGIPIL
jgi:fido (protein-threonine AMPylation protein)